MRTCISLYSVFVAFTLRAVELCLRAATCSDTHHSDMCQIELLYNIRVEEYVWWQIRQLTMAVGQWAGHGAHEHQNASALEAAYACHSDVRRVCLTHAVYRQVHLQSHSALAPSIHWRDRSADAKQGKHYAGRRCFVLRKAAQGGLLPPFLSCRAA